MSTISVVIPVYNTESYIADCLASIHGQTFQDFEAIIVDDGSTDGSTGIAKEFAKEDPRFRIVSQANKGLSEARNAGIEVAEGDWITFVDSDDMIAPNFLQALFNAAMQTGADIACCAKHFFGEGNLVAGNGMFADSGIGMFADSGIGMPAGERLPGKKTHAALSPAKALANALYQNDKPDYSAWNKLYATRLWKTRRFPAGKYFEDMATIPQVFLDARLVAFVPEPLYMNRRHSASILATAYDCKKAELLDIAEAVCDLIAGKGAGLMRAARSNLFSASCSILMRTSDTPEFADYRDRAWKHIRELRLGALLNPRTRCRNKAAALISFAGRAALVKALRRHG
ncbi:MAG: glycosyltransferase [Fibrobacter sp.]|nr:glycosyltransferase [Fibrobacter sp.]